MDEFTTIAYLLSFPGMLIAIWWGVQFTKGLFDKAFPDNKTKYIVLIFTIVLVSCRTALIASQTEVFSFESVLALIIEWLFNIILIWLTVMKGHELLIEKGDTND